MEKTKKQRLKEAKEHKWNDEEMLHPVIIGHIDVPQERVDAFFKEVDEYNKSE